MTDYKTLRVPVSAWEEAKTQKEDHDRTWGEQIVRVEDSSTPDNGDSTTVVEANPEKVAEQVVELLVTELGDGSYPNDERNYEPVLNRLDDLEAELPRKVATELQR